MLQTLRVQSALREADRRKSEFLATLSHELRNPLAAMSYALKLAESGNGDQTAALEVMRRQVQQLVRLVDDLLDATPPHPQQGSDPQIQGIRWKSLT